MINFLQFLREERIGFLLYNEQFIYLGDLENLPYGNKSKDRIINYSLKCAKFLQSKNVKAIIIACNSASSVAVQTIKTISDIPIFEVITPSVIEAVIKTINANNFPWLKSANKQYRNTGTSKILVDVRKLGIHLYFILKNVSQPVHQSIV